MQPNPLGDVRGILRRIATYAPGSVIPALLTLASSVVFTRVFTASEFGVYSLVLVTANTVKIVLTMWLSQGIGRYLPAARDEHESERTKAAVFVSLAMIIAIETAIGAGLLAFGAALFPPAEGDFAPAAVAFVIVSSAFDLIGLIFPAEHRAGETVTYKLVDSVTTFVLRLLMISSLLEFGINAMMWSVALSNGALLPIMWRRAGMPKLRALWGESRDPRIRSTARCMFAFGFPMTVWYFGSVMLDVGDRFVIAYLLGPADVGIYDANYRLITGTVALMVVPITMTLHPMLMSASSTGQSGPIARALQQIIESLAILAAIAVGLTAVLYPYLALLLGPEFREGAFIMPIVLAGVFAFQLGTFAHKPFEISRRTRPMVALVFVAAGVNFALNFALVPAVGYAGAAWATLVSYILYTVLVGFASRRVIPWRFDWVGVLRQALPIGLASGALVALRSALAPLPAIPEVVLIFLACGVVGGWFMIRLIRQISTSVTTQVADPLNLEG